MNRKAIKEAWIQFSKDADEEYIGIRCDIDFALSLQRYDIIQVESEATTKNFPYLKATTKQIEELSNGWYVVIRREIMDGDSLDIIMENIHEGSKRKEKFAHLFE